MDSVAGVSSADWVVEMPGAVQFPVGTRRTDQDAFSALDEILQQRSVIGNPTAEVDTSEFEELNKFDIQGFCTAFHKLRNRMKDAQQRLLRANTSRENYASNIADILDKLGTLSLEEHASTVIMDIINNRMHAYFEELDIDGIQQQLTTYEKLYQNALPIIGLVKEKILEDTAGSSEELICPMCLTNRINMVLIPCGHSLCSACTMRSSSGSCHMCRALVQHVNRLYV